MEMRDNKQQVVLMHRTLYKSIYPSPYSLDDNPFQCLAKKVYRFFFFQQWDLFLVLVLVGALGFYFTEEKECGHGF